MKFHVISPVQGNPGNSSEYFIGVFEQVRVQAYFYKPHQNLVRQNSNI